MKRNNVIVLILCILGLFAGQGLSAAAVELKVGLAPAGTYTTKPEKDAEPSWEITAEVRKAVKGGFELGFGTGYERHGAVKAYTDVESPTLKVNVGKTKLYDSIPLYLTARYVFNKNGDWQPYLRANLGWSFNINEKNTNRYETIYKTTGVVADEGWLRRFKAKDGLYYSLGAGVGYKNFTFDVSYTVNTAKIESENYLFQKSGGKADFSRIVFSLGYQFRFGANDEPDYVKDDKRKLLARRYGKEKATARPGANKAKKQDTGPKILKEELPKEQREFFERGQGGETPGAQTLTAAQIAALPRFPIHTIWLADEAQLLPDALKYGIIESYEGRELNYLDIKALGEELNAAYAKAGYVTTKVMLPGQDITTGELKLVVVYGKIAEIVLDGDGKRDRRSIAAAFPAEAGDILNLRDLDQGIDNLNRLESNAAAMDLVPGETFGYSRVIVASNRKKRWRAGVGYSDIGRDKQRVRTSLELDNGFGINDSLSLYYTADARDFGRDKKAIDRTASYGAAWSFPLKTWEFSFGFNKSSEKNYRMGAFSLYELETRTKDYSFTAGKLIFRNSDHKIRFDAGFALKGEKTFLDKTRLVSQDRTYGVLTLGVNGIWRALGGMASYEIRYHQGLSTDAKSRDTATSIGVMPDPDALSSDKKYAFRKWTAAVSWYRPFALGRQRFTFRTMASGQFSRDNLFSGERITVGGFDSVRGYGTGLSGDLGFYARTELSWVIPVPEKTGPVGRFFSRLRPYAGIDFGKVRDNYDASGKKGGPVMTAAGYSAGLRWYGEKLTIDAGVVKGDRNLGGVKKDRYRGYLSFSLSL
ncbi:MAG: outer membrane beta-barrel protein [Fusobacteriaceae bacterium]|nr:outer membrane beta-barrel protein [Fusobacteriaceae bacterium]